MFVRSDVAEELKKAQGLLPAGMYLIVFDSYRTLEVQQSLFNQYYQPLGEQYPDWTEEQLLTETQKYVSLPSQDATRPSPHNTGGSVDLAIFKLPDDVNQQFKDLNQQIAQLGDNWQEIYKLEMRKLALIGEHAQLLNFGTPFDWGGKEAAINWLETKESLLPEEQEARDNRRLLYNVMTEAGFEPYEDEWWHYNSKKSQMGAKTAGLGQAEYAAAALSDENKSHEQMRKDHRLGSIRILGGATLNGKVNVLEEAYKVVQQSLSESGDPRISSLPESAKIAPIK